MLGVVIMKLLDVLNEPWAIVPDRLLEIQAIYFTHLRGEKIDLKGLEATLGRPVKNETIPYQVENGVAIIEIGGVIAKKMNLFTEISGGVSTQLVKADFNKAMNDPEVRAILLDIDSPGGMMDGTEDLAGGIMDARQTGSKPVVAFTDGMMASAAYWIGSAAELIYIAGTTQAVGSIGVVMAHTDQSGMEEKMGIKTTEIYAGKYKRIASEHEPLTKEGKAYLQDRVDYAYSVFVNAVSRQKGLSLDVLETWADGKLFMGQQAIDAGLVDGVSTKDRLIYRLGTEGKTMILRERIALNARRN